MNQRSDNDNTTTDEAHQISRRGLLGGMAAVAGGAALAGAVSPAFGAAALAQDASPAALSDAQVSMGLQKPKNFNPLFTQSGYEQQIQRLIFGALVKMNDKLEPVADLAESIDVSPDATVYTFHLKQVSFNDGQPLTAKDVVFTINRAVDERTGSVWRGRLLKIQGAQEYSDQTAETISGLETPDDYTVKMTLAEPDASFLVTLADFSGLGILPAHVLEDIAPEELQKAPFTLNPNVSAGAFSFTTFATDQYVQLDRNDAYTGGPLPAVSQIYCKIVTGDTALAQMAQGDLDIFGPSSLPVAEMDFVKSNDQLVLESVKSPSVTFVVFNFEKPYLQDKRVRQAMQYAIDRAAIVESLFKGEGEVINSTIIGPDWMGTPEGLNEYEYNPDKAKELLAEANWDSSQKLGIIFGPGYPEQDAYAAIIQQQLQDIGLDVFLDVSEDWGTRLVDTADYDLALADGGVFRADPDVSSKYFATANFTPAGGNYAHYSNPALDDLFTAGRATSDLEQRKEIYTQAAQILNDEVPWIFLWSPHSIFAYNKRLVGFKAPAYYDNKLWNAEEWSVTS